MREWIQNHFRWIVLIVSLIGGGAMGAVITALVNNHKTKRQSVSFVFNYLPVCAADLERIPFDEKKPIQSLLDTGALFTGNLWLRNDGNLDINEFHFGVTLSSGKIASVLPFSLDRHHSVKHHPIEGFSAQADFTLEPFNRDEIYIISLLVATAVHELPGKVELSSPHSARFVERFAILPEKHIRMRHISRESGKLPADTPGDSA